MRLGLTRRKPGKASIIGSLTIDGVYECLTLEDPKDVIQTGNYPVKITYSPKFKRNMPELFGVKGREYIRIHPGNTAMDTEGCILVGTTADGDSILHSRVAFDHLFTQLQLAKLPITITVV